MALFAVDIDGTILGRNYTLYESTYKNLKQINDNTKHSVTIVTARPLHMAQDLVEKLGVKDPIILLDGDLIYDVKNKKVLYENYINYTDLEIIGKNDLSNSCIFAHTQDFICIIGTNDKTSTFVEFLNIETSINNFMKYLWFSTFNKFIEFINENKSKVFNLTIMSLEKKELENDFNSNKYKFENLRNDWGWKIVLTTNTSNKKYGIEWLENYLGLKQCSIITIGNNENDIEMLRYSTLSACVSDGTNATKESAKMIIDESYNNGVDKFIKKIIDGEIKWY